jgi:glycosyltransferase involved in cell wall biosynthesis
MEPHAKTLKVLNVYRTYFPDPPGGLQEAIRQICLATGKHGVENTIYTLSPHPAPETLVYPEGRIVRSRSWAAPASCNLGGVGSLVRFRRLAKDADVVHYFFPWPFADVLHWLACPRKPTVMTYISDIVRQRWLGAAYAPLMWRTLRSVDAIVANCPAYAKTSPVLVDETLSRKLRVIPLGIDESAYPQAGDERVLTRLGLQPAQPYFLFLGVLRYYKGLHTLIQAACSVGAVIVIAGSGPEGMTLQQQAQRAGVDNAIFSGQVTDSEKVALIKNCLALVLPSHLRSEAFGMVLVEAAMFGKPMISCEIGTGTSYVNLDNETGFVVPPESAAELAAAMSRLLNDFALAGKLGRAARRRYEKLFSGDVLGGAYAGLYHDAVSRKCV